MVSPGVRGPFNELSSCVARQSALGHVDFFSQEFRCDRALFLEFLRRDQPIDVRAGVLDAVARHRDSVHLLAVAARLSETVACAALVAGTEHLRDEALAALFGRGAPVVGGQNEDRGTEGCARACLSSTPLPELTTRERDPGFGGGGERDRDIADRLSLSSATVKTHVHRILTKLRVDSRFQAGLVYRERMADRPEQAGHPAAARWRANRGVYSFGCTSLGDAYGPSPAIS